jgi:hypothetical protein
LADDQAIKEVFVVMRKFGGKSESTSSGAVNSPLPSNGVLCLAF